VKLADDGQEVSYISLSHMTAVLHQQQKKTCNSILLLRCRCYKRFSCPAESFLWSVHMRNHYDCQMKVMEFSHFTHFIDDSVKHRCTYMKPFTEALLNVPCIFIIIYVTICTSTNVPVRRCNSGAVQV